MTTEEFNRLQADTGQFSPSNMPPLEPDIEKYRHELAEFNLGHEAETQLLMTLWQIMAAFVDKGFTTDIEAMFGANGEIDPEMILGNAKQGETA